MEEGTIANKEVPLMNVPEKLESTANPVQWENERKDDDKNLWDDGEFIKVDRETFDADQVTSAEEGKPSVGESSRGFLEAKEKIKELEIELERTATALKASESQNVQLKDEILLKEEKLEGNGKKYEELELDRKNLHEKMTQAENNFNQKLNALQHASEELVEMKESYDNLNLSYENSKRNIEELEGKLESQAAQFEGMVKSCHSKIEDADKRVSEVESLLEAKRKIIEELARHLSLLESKCLDEESESKKYSDMVSELTEELKKSRSSILSVESALQIATQKENALVESLNVVNEEKRNSAKKLLDAEYLLEALRNELSLKQENVGGIENDLKASGLRESEIIEKLRSAERQLEQQEREIEEARARKMELQSLHESSTRDFERKLQEKMEKFTKEAEAKSLSDKLKTHEDKLRSYEELKRVVGEAEDKVAQSLSENELLAVTNSQLKNKIDELQDSLNFANSEKEAISLQLASHMNTITELTDQHSRSIEISHTATETQRLQAEGQLKEITDKLAGKEREVKELHEQVVALESRVKRYEVEAHDSAGIAEFRKLQVQEMVGKLVEKKDQVKELNNMLSSLESQVKIYEEEIHQASGLAESRKVEIGDMIAKLRHKEFEVKGLNEKIYALEVQLKTFQDEASEVSSTSESRRLEIENTILKLQDHSKIAEELQFELSQVETRNEALAEANMKLTQDLALAETEQSDLYAKLSRASDDKDDLTAQYDLSKKIIEDLTEELSFEKQRRQSEIATALEVRSKLHEAKKDLQATVNHLEDQLEGYRGNEDTQKAELENLKFEITEKSAFLKKLEEQYQTAEAQLKDEVKSVERAAVAREGDLTSQLEHHVRKLHDRDLLDERVLQLEQELQLAQATVSKLVSESEAARSHASDNVEAKNTKISLLAKKVEELEQKLKVAEAIPKQKSNLGTQEVETEVSSRDIGSMDSSPVKLKSKMSEEPSSSTLARAPTSEASSFMNFKLILGVALVSIIIGVILGKRY